MNTKHRPSGIDGLGDMSWGTHFCLFYETSADLLDILIPYFKAGLERNEFCLCVASQPVTVEEAELALRAALPDFERYLTAGQIEIIPHTDWYLADGRFDPLKVRQGWLDKLEHALARGYAGMRFIANISWLEKQGWDHFAEYEGTLDEVFRRSQMIGICAYSLERCSAIGILDVMRHHQFTLARRGGTWEPLESKQLKRAHEEVLKLNAELEQRVRDRTAELTDINEQLGIEIDRRKRTEEALQQDADQIRDLYNNAPCGYHSLDENGIFLEINDTELGWLGLRREDVIGKMKLEAVLTAEGRKLFHENFPRLKEKGSIRDVEVQLVPRAGTPRSVLLSATAVRDGAGNFLMTRTTMYDITERKRAEEQSNLLQTILMEVSETGDLSAALQVILRLVCEKTNWVYGQAWLPRQDGSVLDCGPAWFSDTSLETFRAISKGLTFPPGRGLPGRVWSSKQPVWLEDASLDPNFPRAEAAAEIRLKAALALPILSDGEVVAVIEFFLRTRRAQDEQLVKVVMAVAAQLGLVIERKQAEERLRREKRLTEQIMNSLPGVFYVLDQQGRFYRWNKNFERVTGYSSAEVARISPLDLFSGEDQKKIEECVQNVFHKGKSAAEVDLVAKDGTRTPYYFTGRRVRLDDKLFDFGMGIDITERRQAEAALKESEERLQLALQAAQIGTGEWNIQADQSSVSNGMEQVFGFAPGAFKPNFTEFVERVYPEDRELFRSRLEEAMANKTDFSLDYRIVWPDGSTHWVTSRGRFFYDDTGQPARLVGVAMDITERKQAEELIRQQSARSQLLADISGTLSKAGLDYQSVLNAIVKRTAELIGDLCVIVTFSNDGKHYTPNAFYHNNPRARELIRKSYEQNWHDNSQRIDKLLTNEIVYMPVMNPDEFRSTLDPAFRPYFDEIGISSLIYVPLQVQGQVMGALGVLRDRSGRPYTPEHQAYLKDIADRAALTMQNTHLFEQIQASQKRLRVLSQRLVEVQESEQKRLAREIHDDVSQTLTALMLQLGTAKNLLPKSAQNIHAILARTEELTEETLERTRSIIGGLRLQVLDDLGLIPALRQLGNELHDSAGAIVKLKSARLPKRLPQPVEVTLFRIVQEAVANIRKHAHARHVTITLAKEGPRIVLSVQDDGAGFEMKTYQSHVNGEMVINGGLVIPAGHFGLIGIQEQVISLGGTFRIESAPSQGTSIQVELPL